MKDFLKVEEQHGVGNKVSLTVHQLECLQRVCDAFRKDLVANCEDYLMYRCTLTSNDTIIYASIACSNLDGALIQCQLGYDYESGEVYTRKITLNNKAKVCKQMYNLIIKLVDLLPPNISVGMLDFPIEGTFKSGYRMGYNKEPGTELFIIEDSLNNSMFMS